MKIKNICILTLLLSFFCQFDTSGLSAADSEIAPEQEVTVEAEKKSGSDPPWKDLWDRAREQVRNNNLTQAKKTYEELVSLKKNIVAASWEYCKLLVRLEEWQPAGEVVSGLLDLEPANQQFLLLAGKIALNNQHYSKATRYFGQVFEADPVGPFSNDAMIGLVRGLTGIKNYKAAFVLLEQYYQRGNVEEDVLSELVSMAKLANLHDKAVSYLKILTKRYPQKKEYLRQIADVYEQNNEIDNAAIYWQRYLAKDSKFIPYHKKLAGYYLLNSKTDDALIHLKKIYQAEPSSNQLALQIADLHFEKQKRADKALLFYENYLKRAPNDKKISNRVEDIYNKLAEDYLPIVENGAADVLWGDLDKITTNKTKIFERILNLLQSEEQSAMEAMVLEILFLHDRELDLEKGIRLARLKKGTGDHAGALELYRLLDEKEYTDTTFLLSKAETEILLGKEFEAFHTLLKYLDVHPENIEVLSRCLELGGKLGITGKVYEQWNKLPLTLQKSKTLLPARIKYVEALYGGGYFTLANSFYLEILNENSNDESVVGELNSILVDSLIRRGYLFKAEQVLRQNLARNVNTDKTLQELVRLSLLQGRLEDANSWLGLLAKRNRVDDVYEDREYNPQDLHFLLTELMIAEEDYNDAEDLVREHYKYLSDTSTITDFQKNSEMYLIRILFYQEEYSDCLERIKRLHVEEQFLDELYVLRSIIHQKERENGLSKTDNTEDASIAFTALLRRAELFLNYGQSIEALEQVNHALTIIPQSMTAQMAKARILGKLSRYDEAIETIDKISSLIPEEEYFQTAKLQYQFESGEFDRVVEEIPYEVEQSQLSSEGGENPESNDMFFSKRLLLARALWAENRRQEAIEVYNSLLEVPVDSLFLEKMEVAKVNFNLPPLKKSVWNIVTFTDPETPDPVATVMRPEFVAENSGNPIDSIAASLYSKYRWQELIQKELSARKAVEKKDYYYAEKEYLTLLEEEKSQESLYDLANIYHKLGLYGKAGEIFETIRQKGPTYPGLEESLQVNLLKRQPRISAVVEADTREGREGYINKKKRSYGLESWLMPTFSQEISLQLYHNKYQSDGNREVFRRQRVLGAYSTYYKNSTDINLHFGVDSPREDGTTEYLYKFEIIHRINRLLEIYGRFEQDLVEDSFRSVSDSIIFKDYDAGLKYDVLPRWFFGLDYRHRTYSDNNFQNRYKFWSQYHLFGEFNQFKLLYSYEYMDNDRSNIGRNNDFSNVFEMGDSVYWSPSNYWQQILNFHYKHHFANAVSGNDAFNYFTLDYSWGYDTNREQSHELDLNFFLEFTRHFLLKGNLRSLNGDDLEETQAALSLIYRW